MRRELSSIESTSLRTSASISVPTASTTNRPSLATTSTRRHSLFGTEDRIVIDLGCRVLKIGFSGESRPRLVKRCQDLAKFDDYRSQNYVESQSDQDDTLWDPDFGKCRSERQREEREMLLKARLIHMFRDLFSNLLMVDPKQRKILVVENALTPTIVRETLCRVLFGNLQVPSVSFIPSSLLSLMATGGLTGLVLSIGYYETSVTPVFAARPMSQYTTTSFRAARRVFNRLKALLLTFARFIPPPTSLQSKPTKANERAVPVPEHLLTTAFLEEIIGKSCLVSQLTQNGKDLSDGKIKASSVWNSVLDRSAIGLLKLDGDGSINLEAMEFLKSRYASQSTASNLIMTVPDPRLRDYSGQSQGTPAGGSRIRTSTTTSAQQQGLTSARGTLVIPGWVRESALEVLFEEGDEDESSITEAVLDCILSIPIDVRRTMVENILVSGGLASAPGFCNRVRQELVKTVDSIDLEAMRAEVSVVMTSGRGLVIRHSAPKGKEVFEDAALTSSGDRNSDQESDSDFKDVEVEPFRVDGEADGNESFASTESEAKQPTAASPTKGHRAYRSSRFTSHLPSLPSYRFCKYAPLRPMIPYLAILNDHAPKLYDDLTAQGGKTPAISPFILSWTGGSLVGGLRTNAVEEITREIWDESEAALKAKDRKVERPVWAGGGKGSFLGDGLDTGTYGALTRLSTRIKSP